MCGFAAGEAGKNAVEESAGPRAPDRVEQADQSEYPCRLVAHRHPRVDLAQAGPTCKERHVDRRRLEQASAAEGGRQVGRAQGLPQANRDPAAATYGPRLEDGIEHAAHRADVAPVVEGRAHLRMDHFERVRAGMITKLVRREQARESRKQAGTGEQQAARVTRAAIERLQTLEVELFVGAVDVVAAAVDNNAGNPGAVAGAGADCVDDDVDGRTRLPQGRGVVGVECGGRQARIPTVEPGVQGCRVASGGHDPEIGCRQ